MEKIKVNEVEVDFIALKLFINNEWQDVESRQLNLLKLLIDNYGKAVSRNQIMDALWNNTIVSDNSVSQAITQLRKALQDDKDTPRFIKTIPRVGYQLIAELTFIQTPPITAMLKPQKWRYGVIATMACLFSIALTLAIIEFIKPSVHMPRYRYESRLTSTPGPESFLRYSPKGRYLAFSQSNETRSQMDLAVFDAQTQVVHLIKSTGYSEEAPEWSPDGKWLIYYRHDPISCEIRIMSVANPVETWRLSPDFHLAYCQVGFSRQKMHWLTNTELYVQRWQHNTPQLTKLTLSFSGLPKITGSEDISTIHPLLMDIDKTTKQLLFVERSSQGYVLQNMNLTTLQRHIIEQQEQEYWGLKWHKSGKNFWLGNESLRLMSLSGESEIIYLPLGFIPDIDENPITKQLAHAEGLVNVNLYTLTLSTLTSGQELVAKQLSSSARTDILPTLSKNGKQIAFVSYQRRSRDGLKHVEVWLKNKDKKAATLLANLPENIRPRYLLWSPNGENLLLGDAQNNLYIINTYSSHLVSIIYDYKNIDKVNWSEDGKYITFSTVSDNKVQFWQYNLQLSRTELLDEKEEALLFNDSVVLSDEYSKNKEIPLLSLAQLKLLNPSYSNFRLLVERFLTHYLAEQLPVENLHPSLMLYRPYVFELGIYYVVKQGHQLKLYLYQFEQQKNVYIANIGNHEHYINLLLNISASADGKQLVFSKVEGFETDILLQSPVSKE